MGRVSSCRRERRVRLASNSLHWTTKAIHARNSNGEKVAKRNEHKVATACRILAASGICANRRVAELYFGRLVFSTSSRGP